MSLDVSGLDHLYVTVSDFERSRSFYDPVMKLLGFKKGTLAVSGDPHCHYFNPHLQYTIRPAKLERAHEPYSPGLHHVCLRLRDNGAVDEAYRELRALGIDSSEPRYYREYADDYYAIFFEDPDGIRLELVAHRRMRSVIRDRWGELVEFEDPLSKAGIS